MNKLNEINWIRRFYRKYLAHYLWGRSLNQVILLFRPHAKEIRGFLVWHLSYKLTAGAIFLSRSVSHSSNPLARYLSLLLVFVIFALLRVLYFLTGQQVSWYTMHEFSKYFYASDVRRRELIPAREIPLVMPDVYPEEFKKKFYSGVWQLSVPAICAFEVPQAQVMGKSDFLFLEDQCLHHGLYHFDRDLLVEEMHDIVSINPAIRKLVRLKGQQVGSIPSGISLVGSATANYVHWLTETLPKLALIDGIGAYRDLPYIIDTGLHLNILESLSHLNINNRNVIQLGRSEMLTVEKLVAISPVAYIPFDFKPGIKPNELDINPGSALYSPNGLQQVRQSMLAFLGETEGTLKRRLFLRRTGKSRPMINSIEVEAMVQEHGFEIIEPETLSFADQVRLFSSAELIVSQGGAALGNIIFAPAGCHVIVLTTWSPYTIHYYFSNLASIMGQRCTLIMCDPIQSVFGPHRAHMGIKVPVPTVESVIGI